MTDTQMRVFIAAADQKSMTKAASILFISVPAVKRHIDSLEKELSCQLFVRSAQGIDLTEEGSHFLDFCRPALKALSDEKKNLLEIGKQRKKIIRIAYDNAHVRDLLFIDACAAFLKEYSTASIQTIQTDFFDPEKSDLFFGASYQERTSVLPHFLGYLPLTCILRKQDNRCQKEYLTLDDLIIDQTIFPPAEMLAYVQPNLIDDLSGKQPFFQPLNENYNSYATTVILEGKVIVYIGEEEQQQLSICQKSLHGYRFSYSCYSSHIKDKPHLRTFIRFLQQYYQQRLS